MVTITFKPITIFRKRKNVQRRSLLKHLSSSFTHKTVDLTGESATQVSESEIGDSTYLLTHAQHHSLVSTCNSSPFTDKLEAIRAESVGSTAATTTTTTEIELNDFIERSTRHDIHLLRDMLDKDDRLWKSVTLEDTTDGRQFRRWTFKKCNVGHHIRSVCESKNISLVFKGTCEVDVDGMPAEGVIALLKEVKKDQDIVNIILEGHLSDIQLRRVLKALTNLVSQSDRTWETVQLKLGFDGTGDYENWESVMESYMGIFSHMYTQYGVPIDLLPCTNN